MKSTVLNGNRVLVTGGAGGVGRAVAARMVQQGARVLISDRGELDLRQAIESIRTEISEAKSNPLPPTCPMRRALVEFSIGSTVGWAGSIFSSPAPASGRAR